MMKRKPAIATKAGSQKSEVRSQKSDLRSPASDLYRRAKARLRKQKKNQKSKTAAVVKTEVDSQRLLHELQVHHVELEMQNAELQEARNRMEVLVEKYTDLYDFAPVGYLSLDEQGQILEVNLSGAALLGVGRAQLINRRLPAFVTPASRVIFLAFLKRVFTGGGKQVCEATLLRADGTSFWADFHGTSAISVRGPRKWCRLVVSDITVLKRAEEAQRRSDAIEASNEELRQEISRRKVIEASLKKSEQHQSRLLAQSRLMQEQLRNLSRQVLHAQEEERKRISRELHDVIAQTLTGINIRLDTLKKEAGRDTGGFDKKIAHTQMLVGKSVDIVHRFARELRPAVLDDLGLIPALHSFLKDFAARTGLRTCLTAFAEVEKMDIAKRTVLFRVAQEALTNVSRHAHASRVEVTLQKLVSGMSMKISDDGKSFQVQRVLLARGNKRLGLLGMRERVEMIGGAFGIESAPGKGTAIQVEIPFAETRGGADGVR